MSLPTADDFKDFLKRYEKVFESGISSLIIDYEEIKKWNSQIAQGFLDSPDIYLTECEKSTKNFSQELVRIFIKNVPRKVPLRELGSKYLGKLISVNGTVVRVVPTRPKVESAAFQCRKCNQNTYVPQNEPFMKKPNICKNCTGKFKGRIFRLLEDPIETKYIDVQELAIQEKPEDLKAGQAPQLVRIEIIREALINGARAGDNVVIVGILKPDPPAPDPKKRKFDMFIDVVYIETVTKDPSEIIVSPEEEQEIIWLAKDPNIYDKIMLSIAPSIYECSHIKEAIMYQLFGGCKKSFSDRTIRGNIHVLWIDDPSTAKSQLLLAACNIAPRGLYVSGGGASGAGLTAAVVKIEGEKVWALEAGAVVIANKGLLCIDEIEKMNDDDRTRIHEAMEQQTVSIQKATAHYILPAETSIVAAGNPKFGRYDTNRTIAENISLPSTILSRFDLIFIGKGDLPDKDRDKTVASHILSPSEKFVPPINKDLLRKYVALAKRIFPQMTEGARTYIEGFYVKMRNANIGDDCPIAITARQLEGLVRIAEAHARIRLSNKIEEEDALAAIKLMTKSLSQVGIDPETGRFDIDAMMGGNPKSLRDKMSKLLDILKGGNLYSVDEIVSEMEKYGVDRGETLRILKQLYEGGDVFSPREGFYQKTR